MSAKLVPRHRFATNNSPLKAPCHRRQIASQHWTDIDDIGQPSQCAGEVLKHIGIDCNLQAALMFINGRYSPGNERCRPADFTYLEIIACTVEPMAELAFEDQTAQVVDFIPGPVTRPHRHRILLAERMTWLKIPRHRDNIPNPLRACIDRLRDTNRPLEAGPGIVDHHFL